MIRARSIERGQRPKRLDDALSGVLPLFTHTLYDAASGLSNAYLPRPRFGQLHRPRLRSGALRFRGRISMSPSPRLPVSPSPRLLSGPLIDASALYLRVSISRKH